MVCLPIPCGGAGSPVQSFGPFGMKWILLQGYCRITPQRSSEVFPTLGVIGPAGQLDETAASKTCAVTLADIAEVLDTILVFGAGRVLPRGVVPVAFYGGLGQERGLALRRIGLGQGHRELHSVGDCLSGAVLAVRNVTSPPPRPFDPDVGQCVGPAQRRPRP